jgi:hypothetical protein
MNAENTIIKKAVSAFESETKFWVSYKKIKDNNFLIEFKTSSGVKTGEYVAEVLPQISNALISEMSLRSRSSEKPMVFVAEYVTRPQTEKLKKLNIQFFDTAGNAYINRNNIYIFITGKKNEVTTDSIKSLGLLKPLNIFRPAGVKFLFACFLKEGFENADYRTIADDIGISKTAVGNLMNDLQKGGYLMKRGGHERFLVKKDELIKRWVQYYGESFRPRLKPVRFHSIKFKGRWWEDIDISEYDAVWGGEPGGEILTNHLRPQTATIYSDSLLPMLQAKYGLVRDKKGEIEILRKFWKFGEVKNVAPPLVVYADLMATADERNIETAQIIYEEHLASIAKEDS